jgi:2-dehydropantoate 2-reductase
VRLLVVGAGSTGGYFGGRLVQAGRDVTFLVRPRRVAQLRATGLAIKSPLGDATLQPRLITAAEVDGTYDAVLLTVKSFSLEAALEDMAPAIGPGTVILPVLNGMRHLDILKARFGEEAVGGCVCKVGTTLDGDGRIIQLSTMQELAYGELDGRPSARMRAVDGVMAGAGFDARLSPAIGREMWEKWVMLATVGAVTCLMRGTLGQVEAAPGGHAFALAVLDEVVAVIAAVGIPPGEGVVDAVRGQLLQKGSGTTSSMYRDLEKGLPVEADAILGDLLRRAREAGIATPLVSAAFTHLSVYAARLAA